MVTLRSSKGWMAACTGSGNHGLWTTFKSRDVGDLARALERLLASSDLVRDRAAGAERRVRDNYSWDSVVDSLEAIYADCLTRPPRVFRAH